MNRHGNCQSATTVPSKAATRPVQGPERACKISRSSSNFRPGNQASAGFMRALCAARPILPGTQIAYPLSESSPRTSASPPARGKRDSMADWFGPLLRHMFGITIGLAGMTALIWWRTRCRHPNPHYIRAGTCQDDARAEPGGQPAMYECYDCGKRWVVRQRDPAWRPTRLVQKFQGYDESKAKRAATRAAIEQEQRRFLAANRVGPSSAPAVIAPQRRRKNVVDIDSRKPA
jgi:hypothetical protein